LGFAALGGRPHIVCRHRADVYVQFDVMQSDCADDGGSGRKKRSVADDVDNVELDVEFYPALHHSASRRAADDGGGGTILVSGHYQVVDNRPLEARSEYNCSARH